MSLDYKVLSVDELLHYGSLGEIEGLDAGIAEQLKREIEPDDDCEGVRTKLAEAEDCLEEIARMAGG